MADVSEADVTSCTTEDGGDGFKAKGVPNAKCYSVSEHGEGEAKRKAILQKVAVKRSEEE